jgi:serine/threonine-protein kinase
MPDVACPTDDWLAAFVDGSLPSADLSALAAHLETCSACQRRLERLDDQPNVILGALRGEPLPVDFQPRTRAAESTPAPSTDATVEQQTDLPSFSYPDHPSELLGLAPRLESEIRALLHRRMLMLSCVGTVPLAILFGLTWTDLHPLLNRSTVGGLPQQLFGMTAVLYVGAALLLSRRPMLSLSRLRMIELAFTGLVVVCVSAWQYATLTRSLPEGFDGLRHREVHHSAASFLATFLWFLLIVVYGIAIPNTWRRTLAVVSGEVTLALVVLLAAGTVNPAVGGQLLVLLPLSVGLLAMALALAVFGSFKISTLQQQAFEARQLGQYRLKRLLGVGGMGEVYLAEHRLLKRPCAVKLIRPEKASNPGLLKRFEREVRVTAQLTHFNTVAVYDYGRTEDGTFYYVMEYLPGLTLETLVKRYGLLPPARAVHFLRQLCGALHEAHGLGLVHRDLKPANVIVCQYSWGHDVVKLVDFGLVRLVDADLSAQPLTRKGMVMGTPDYLAPEQAEGGPAEVRSDLYSLGAVAYFLLTGRPPFPRPSVLETLLAHLHDPVPPLADRCPGVPAELEAVVLRCLAKDPAERFVDAQSLDEALARCVMPAWTEADAAAWWKARTETGAGATLSQEKR